MKWEQGEFEINTDHGVNRVDGFVFAPFGVDLRKELWRITHLPSGLCVPYGFTKMTDATQVADEIRRVWNSTDDPYPQNDPELWSVVKTRVGNVLRSTKVKMLPISGPDYTDQYQPVNGYDTAIP